jgi:hypothetical protein
MVKKVSPVVSQRVIKRIHIVPRVDVSFNVKWEKSQIGRHLFVDAVNLLSVGGGE